MERYARILAVIWTIVVATSLVWSIAGVKKQTFEDARTHAHINYIKDVLYRHWNASHGGVYVPVTEKTPPNPYLSHVPERDITTPSGKRLTLINPAYMTRQVYELMEKTDGVRGHITSLQPIRPENAPDAWESQALRSLEQGKTDISSISKIEGKMYYRQMYPFITEQPCLKCHAKQGYREGDVRGGLSVSVPMEPLLAMEHRNSVTFILVHGLLWFVGLVGINYSMQRIKSSERERKEAEEEVKHLAFFTASIINSLPGIFYLFDEHGRFIRWNENFERVTGYSAAELSVMAPPDFFGGGERELIAEKIKDIFATGQSFVEANLESKEGKKTPYFFTGESILLENKKYLIGTGIDITERKAAEEALRKMAEELIRSNSDLRQFAYVASHDLQEPLRVISSCLQLLVKRYRGNIDENADDLIRHVVDSAKRMHELIRDILDYSRLEIGEKLLKTVDISKVIEELIVSLKAGIEGSGAIVTYDQLPAIIADAAHMNSLFHNLISNAIKFHGKDSPRVHISAKREDDGWVFSVQDNGIGIDPEFTDKIFDIFKRLHTKEEYPGTGIGLAACKKIVEYHGGRIWVESKPGKGSTFYFSIPHRRKSS